MQLYVHLHGNFIDNCTILT